MKPRAQLWVPGRIEVLGKHTDYAGGRSLVCAIERGFTAYVTPRADQTINVHDTGRNESFRTELSASAAGERGSWGAYVATVARRIARDFPSSHTGADIELASTLPPDAGLSSSSALVVTIGLAIIYANDLETNADFSSHIPARTDLAGYLGAVENGRPYGTFVGDAGVGTFGGSEDHTAILCSRKGELSAYSYAPVRHEGDVRIPSEWTFAIGVSGIVANKTGAALGRYNALSVATQDLLRIWNGATGRNDQTLAAALDSSPQATGFLRTQLDPARDAGLVRRFEQFVEESNTIVPSAVRALQSQDVGAFGSLVDRSQQLAEQNLGNQVAETVALQRMAREEGAVAASAFGAGFGGSVWALVRQADVETFMREWSTRFRGQFPHVASHASFFATRPGEAAHEVHATR